MLNPHSPLPLYHQLAAIIREKIEAGDLRVDEKIPSENDMARTHGIGRPTVRQATDLLVREGVLERRRGSGTYVLPPAKRIDLFSLAGTSEAFKQSQLKSATKLLDFAYLKTAPEYLPEPLRAGPVYYVERLSLIDDAPVLLEQIYLESSLFKGLENIDLAESSLARLARDRFFLEATQAEQRFRVQNAGKRRAELLNVKPAFALLHVQRTLHFGANKSAVYSDIYCRTDQYHFSQTISPMPNQGV